MEISKNKIRYFASFTKKKVRDEAGFFVVEGNKMVAELLETDFHIEAIVATKEWICNNNTLSCECYEATHEEISKISLLQHPQDVWALVKKKTIPNDFDLLDDLILALDGVQDPGNMGTIIRLADWFGITQIVCSKECVDIYNPKVVQATMGSIYRISVHYVDLPSFLLKQVNKEIYVADMEGENVYSADLPHNAILVMGNEGNGISDEVAKIATKKIHIPTFNDANKTSESLNVAIATAILCSEFRRRSLS